MHTKDKSIFTLPSGVRVVGFDSLETMAKICNVTLMEFAQSYGSVVEKLTTFRLMSKKDPLIGKIEE